MDPTLCQEAHCPKPVLLRFGPGPDSSVYSRSLSTTLACFRPETSVPPPAVTPHLATPSSTGSSLPPLRRRRAPPGLSARPGHHTSPDRTYRPLGRARWRWATDSPLPVQYAPRREGYKPGFPVRCLNYCMSLGAAPAANCSTRARPGCKAAILSRLLPGSHVPRLHPPLSRASKEKDTVSTARAPSPFPSLTLPPDLPLPPSPE